MACRRTRKLWGHRSVLASTVTLTLLLARHPRNRPGRKRGCSRRGHGRRPRGASRARGRDDSRLGRAVDHVLRNGPGGGRGGCRPACCQGALQAPRRWLRRSLRHPPRELASPLGGSSSGAPTFAPTTAPGRPRRFHLPAGLLIGVARRHDRPPRRDRGLGRHPPQRAARLAGPIAGQGDRGRSRSARPPGHAGRRGRPDPRRRTPCARRLTALRPALELRSCVGVPAAGRHATRRPGGVRRAADRGAGGEPVSFVVGHRSPAGGGGPTRRGHGRAAGRRRSCRRYPRASACRASGGTCRHRGARRLGGSSDRRRRAGWV